MVTTKALVMYFNDRVTYHRYPIKSQLVLDRIEMILHLSAAPGGHRLLRELPANIDEAVTTIQRMSDEEFDEWSGNKAFKEWERKASVAKTAKTTGETLATEGIILAAPGFPSPEGECPTYQHDFLRSITPALDKIGGVVGWTSERDKTIEIDTVKTFVALDDIERITASPLVRGVVVSTPRKDMLRFTILFN
jgi:hypothetical protein